MTLRAPVAKHLHDALADHATPHFIRAPDLNGGAYRLRSK
jgi:hypothetical protein